MQIWPEPKKLSVSASAARSRSASFHTTQPSLPASSRIGLLAARNRVDAYLESALAAAEEEDVVDQRAVQPPLHDVRGPAADHVERPGRGAQVLEDRRDDLAPDEHDAVRRAPGSLDDQGVACDQRRDAEQRVGGGGVLRRAEHDDAVGLSDQDQPTRADPVLLVQLSAPQLEGLRGRALKDTGDLPLGQAAGLASLGDEQELRPDSSCRRNTSWCTRSASRIRVSSGSAPQTGAACVASINACSRSCSLVSAQRATTAGMPPRHRRAPLSRSRFITRFDISRRAAPSPLIVYTQFSEETSEPPM